MFLASLQRMSLSSLYSSDQMSTGIIMWVHNAVYSLTNSDKEIILSPSGHGWLNDSMISA